MVGFRNGLHFVRHAGRLDMVAIATPAGKRLLKRSPDQAPATGALCGNFLAILTVARYGRVGQQAGPGELKVFSDRPGSA